VLAELPPETADDDIEDLVTFVGAEVRPILQGATR
jgi:hypothetical protein